MYTDERNIQILVSMLKSMGIRKLIASPGTTNYSFMGSVQEDPFFEIYSSVDERSAAYMACGMATESGEPVMLSCTGSTASRNYHPGLTEAYYRKLPIIAITFHQGEDRIGQLVPQNIDRRRLPDDLVRMSVHIPVVEDERDYRYACTQINKALLALSDNGGGPVHINMTTTYSRNFSVPKLPEIPIIERIVPWQTFPHIPPGKIAIYIGSHSRFTPQQTRLIDSFCNTHDAVVLCDHTSGYYGRYKLLPTLLMMQDNFRDEVESFDLMIHIGEVSAAIFAGNVPTKEIWRVSEDGELRNPFGRLTKVFKMSEEMFFSAYGKGEHQGGKLYVTLKQKFEAIYTELPELPFSNIWIAQHLSKHIPSRSLVHISASHSRRAWNLFPMPEEVETMCNVGVCGIDGCTSTLVGASLARPETLCFLVTGDLAFFYDLNVLGNRHVGKNIRILLINNGIGGEFKLIGHPCHPLGEKANPYMAADGHFGHMSPNLVRHFTQDLGFKYLTASSKEEFMERMREFTSAEIGEKSMVFEVFTDYRLEDEALTMIYTIRYKDSHIKALAKKIIGEKGFNSLKKKLGH